MLRQAQHERLSGAMPEPEICVSGNRCLVQIQYHHNQGSGEQGMNASATVDLSHTRVDQVGSLLRPEWLKEAYAEHQAGKLNATQLREAQDRAIREVIGRQAQMGYGVVTDGEYRRLN